MPPRTGTNPNTITHFVEARQSTTTVQSDQSSSGSNLSSGAIAGIVIGSVVGFLLLLWIFKSFSNLGAPPQEKRDPAWRRIRDGHQER
ncbi:hypothetical protein VSDG_00950 [Cytospora chrysosperma]|uniref:Mid2 domain-containing protein n=1 Tax=Cytospora chrysosperma TaxID=252740 RepID=A0A423WLR0_CYTCH|nr:hypothetical protein VSDG_00950 [Valsa sordida]